MILAALHFRTTKYCTNNMIIIRTIVVLIIQCVERNYGLIAKGEVACFLSQKYLPPPRPSDVFWNFFQRLKSLKRHSTRIFCV